MAFGGKAICDANSIMFRWGRGEKVFGLNAGLDVIFWGNELNFIQQISKRKTDFAIKGSKLLTI